MTFRRLVAAVALFAACSAPLGAAEAPPRDNPVATFYAAQADVVPAWVAKLPWSGVVSVAAYPGDDDDARFAAARADLVKRGGGVLYFPPGVYRFKDHLDLAGGVILRGAPPADPGDAKRGDYRLPTRFEFPKYEPTFTGNGTPIETAFKSIRLDPAGANAGVVHVAINRGHLYFPEAEDHRTAPNRLVFGCLLTNTAAADPGVPDASLEQAGHQRWTLRHRAAIHVFAGRNVLVANNRIPKSGDDNFEVPNSRLARPARWGGGLVTLEKGVVFDYDNRPGIYVNPFGIPGGTPETMPWGFRAGALIRDNYVYCSGRSAIHFTGDGTVCSYNVIRFPAGVWRPTCTGRALSRGGSTNDNRALTMRGWRWTAQGNDYVVHSNMSYERHIPINDGEGIMHEHWANSTIKDSQILDNRGNRYLCLWDSDVDGLLIRGNRVGDDGDPAIHVLGGNRSVRNLRIEGNEVTENNIQVTAGKAGEIVIRGNRYTGEGEAKIVVYEADWVSGENPGFATEIKPRKKPRR